MSGTYSQSIPKAYLERKARRPKSLCLGGFFELVGPELGRFCASNASTALDDICCEFASSFLEQTNPFESYEMTDKRRHSAMASFSVVTMTQHAIRRGDGVGDEDETSFTDLEQEFCIRRMSRESKYGLLGTSCTITKWIYCDRCDGIMDDAMPVRLVDIDNSSQWVPARISDYEVLHSRISHTVREIYAWYVADKTDHYVFGFKDLRGSGKYFYVVVYEDGHLRLSSNFDPPYNITTSNMSNDPRVIHYHGSRLTGKHVLRSIKYSDYYINVVGDYVKAIPSTEQHSTQWSLSPR